MLAATMLSALQFVDTGVIKLRLADVDGNPERYWFLPSMETADLPAPRIGEHRLEDGRFLISHHFEGPFELFDPTTGALRSLFADDGIVRLSPDGSGIVVAQAGCCTGQAEGPLWFVTWEGAQERLAHRVTFPYDTLSDNRVLTTVDVGEDLLGSLVVVDPGTLDELRIDDHVLLTGLQSVEDDTVVYAVIDGERSGVWMAGLAP